LLDKRRAVGVSADEPIFGTVDGTFRDPRTVTRWLVEARKRQCFEEWMTFHAWRKTTATLIRWPQAKVWGNLWVQGRTRRREAPFALVRELARGLEPLTCCL
jgi:hypothetical protein